MAVRVGLRDLYFALLTDDQQDGTTTYETPERIAPAITAKITPTTNSATLYADDQAIEAATALGETTIELNVSDLPSAVQAKLLGHEVKNGVLLGNVDDVAPYVALGFRSIKSNGKFRYYWLYKGRFSLPEEEFKTKEDTPEFQTPTISATFLPRLSDGRWKAMGDEDETEFTAGATWFDAVYEVPTTP